MKKRVLSIVLASAMTIGSSGLAMAETTAKDAKDNVPYINGYEDKTFKPEDNVKRTEISKMIVIVKELNKKGAIFSDVALDHWASDFIGGVQSAGIMKGDENGNFRPESGLSRAELATMVSRILKEEGVVGDKTVSFTDIKGHWAEEAIQYVAETGVINGYEDGSFRPDGKITRQETVKMINGMAGRNIAPDILDKVENIFRDVSESNWGAKDIIGASGEYKYKVGVNGVEEIVTDDEEEEVIPPVETGKLEIISAEAVNLNQLVIKFGTKVDKDSAEVLSNYKLGNSTLSNNDAVELQEDLKTLYINLDSARTQDKMEEFSVVEDSIYDEDLTETISAYAKNVNFLDKEEPTIKGIEVRGNRKLVVELSEAVKLNNLRGTDFKIDEDYLNTYGVSSIETPGTTANNKYGSKIIINFRKDISVGKHAFTVLGGNSANFIDAAGFKLDESAIDIEVLKVEEAPTIEKVVGEDNGFVEVSFNRAMDSETALKKENYKIKGANALSAEFKAGSDEKIVKLRFASLASGEAELAVEGIVKDNYGNKMSDTVVKEGFTIEKDTDKPIVLSAYSVDNQKLRIKYNELVDEATATKHSNYEVRDVDDKVINIESIKKIDDGSLYEIDFGSNLSGGIFTIKITGVKDLSKSANTMEEYIKTFESKDTISPEVINGGVVKLEGTDNKVAVLFTEAITTSSMLETSNYKFRDGTGKVKDLPAGTEIVPYTDSKSLEVVFPSDYRVYTENESGGNTEKSVKELSIYGLEDLSGNKMVPVTSKIKNFSEISGADYITNSFGLSEKDGEIVGEVEFDYDLSKEVKEDFRVEGYQPDYIKKTGSKIEMFFTSDEAKGKIKRAGSKASFSTVAQSEIVSEGRFNSKIKEVKDQKVYREKLSPQIEAVGKGSYDDEVVIKFTEDMDFGQLSMENVVKFFDIEDSQGKNTIERMTLVDGNSLKLSMKNNIGTNSILAVNSEIENVLKDVADGSKNQNYYVPSRVDIVGRRISDTITSSDAKLNLELKVGTYMGSTKLTVTGADSGENIEYQLVRSGGSISQNGWSTSNIFKALDYQEIKEIDANIGDRIYVRILGSSGANASEAKSSKVVAYSDILSEIAPSINNIYPRYINSEELEMDFSYLILTEREKLEYKVGSSATADPKESWYDISSDKITMRGKSSDKVYLRKKATQSGKPASEVAEITRIGGQSSYVDDSVVQDLLNRLTLDDDASNIASGNIKLRYRSSGTRYEYSINGGSYQELMNNYSEIGKSGGFYQGEYIDVRVKSVDGVFTSNNRTARLNVESRHIGK